LGGVFLFKHWYNFSTAFSTYIHPWEALMQDFNYVSASSLQDVFSLLSDGRDGAKLLAGGTDLLVQLREGRAQARLVIDVKNIPELSEIEYDAAAGLRLGAAVSCYRLCHDPRVAEFYPGLVDAFSLIGGIQIQNRASVGGNICNASPAADAIPALIAHQAVCQVVSAQGQRQVPIESFCTAPGKNVLQPGEILLSVTVPPPVRHFGAHYLRFIPRNEMDIAVVGAGAGVILDEDCQRFVDARVALGAVAPTPLFVPEAGEYLAGKPVSPEVIQEAARIAQAAARPISDLRGSAEHRKHLCFVLARRAIETAVERARR
jgi:carbon-monoxide dehydrogenase medium subunit